MTSDTTTEVAPLGAPRAVQTNTPGAPNAALAEPAPTPGDGVNRLHPAAARLVVTDQAQAVVLPAPGTRKRRNIAICGFASSTRKYILEWSKRDDWEIWGLNQLYRHIPRADRWFDIHHNWDKETVPGTDHRKWAQECGIPLYMMQCQPDAPTSVTYPLKQVMAHFGGIDYFTSTIPYMLALAIMEIDEDVSRRLNEEVVAWHSAHGFASNEPMPNWWKRQHDMYGEYSIGIFGIDLVVGGEYFQEKPCAEFWIGAAALGRGIKLLIPPESALCKQFHRYGYDPEPNQFLRTTDITEHTKQVTAERDEQLKRLYMLEGVLQANERWSQYIDLRSRGAQV